jgi:predicted ATP-binding protein involved in virulence
MPATRWLLSLDDESFDFAGRAIRRLLLEPESTVLHRDPPEVILRRTDDSISLHQLSDGYRSMLTLAVDLMSTFLMRFGSLDAAEGIVLVDELSAHLHPKWQMRIVRAFRQAFPRLQVIATTHDPLCLRGMLDREVVVLRQAPSGRIYDLPPEEVPSVQGLRVDELLTSEIFGLNSTVDENVDSLFRRYYQLLAMDERGTLQDAEIAELRDTLDKHRQFGTTRRERLALEAADNYAAEEQSVTDRADRLLLSDDIRKELRAIWAGEAG